MTTIVNVNKEKYDVYIARPSKWGNPYTHIKGKFTRAEFVVKTRKRAVDCYREWIENGDGQHLLKDLHELKDKRLGCFCSPKKCCHGEVLIELIEKYCNNGFQI